MAEDRYNNTDRAGLLSTEKVGTLNVLIMDNSFYVMEHL
jgi:hypothetical protein